MLWVPSGYGDFRWQTSNVETTRPVAGFGTTVTAGGTAHTKGSYTTILSAGSVLYDVCAMMICISNVFTSATITSSLLDIAVDPTGGTTFASDLIPNLMCGGANSYILPGGGVCYYFPIGIKAGSTIGARMQSAVASKTASVAITLFGRPADPQQVKVGSYVEALGVNTATSAGAALTEGTTSDGAFALMGTTTRDSWFYQFGIDWADTTRSSVGHTIDVAMGTSTSANDIVIRDAPATTTSTEQLSKPLYANACARRFKAGTNAYMRSQVSGTADSACTGAVYTVWG